MTLREIPSWKFKNEIENVHAHVFGFCVAMDKTLGQSNIFPARLQECLWNNVFAGEVPKNHEGLLLLTKYMMIFKLGTSSVN